NVNDDTFCAIWNSEKYRKFRQQAADLNKKALLKEGCKCHSCVDYGANLGIYRKLHPIKARKLI
ncbi:SPASM domain-containing protein, partial [Candidatus Omnitrophota bacterium]